MKCEHNKNQYYCKECKGAGICEHNRQQSRCVKCKGGSICEHNKRKNRCRECGTGNELCEHKKLRYECKECDGKGFCEHKKYKAFCKECKGTQICEHYKVKYTCKDCKGLGICGHNRRKDVCKECNGNKICEHNKEKQQCIICSSNIGCQNCKLNIKSQNKTYKPYCFKCYCVLNPNIEIKKRYKTKEFLLAEAIKNMKLGFDFIQDKPVDGGCSRKRPDFLFDLFTHTVIIECDEFKHQKYNTTCELDKLNSTFTDLGDRPMILLRFNPDKSKQNGKSCFDKDCKLIISEWNKRIRVLKTELASAIKNIPTEIITIKYLF
jgi:hypothetical protein